MKILGWKPIRVSWVIFYFLGQFPQAYAETGAEGWLRYAPLSRTIGTSSCDALPSLIVSLDNDLTSQTALQEAARGINSMCGRTMRRAAQISPENAIVLGTVQELKVQFPEFEAQRRVDVEGFSLAPIQVAGHKYVVVAGSDGHGILYGTFRLLEMIGQQEDITKLSRAESPSSPIRWVNQWDNLDGSVERGYAGGSIFFVGGEVRTDLTRVQEYGRLLASVGINGCTINNVNSDLRMLTPEMIGQVARIAIAFRPWGVRVSLSIDLSSPKQIGGLDSFDPLDPRVKAWWQSKVDEIYRAIPDFAGFVVKADSEGRPGPSQYGRSPAEAANTLAHALKSHGGVVLYRGFVYNHHLDWTDLKADRARAGYDNFYALDGQFDDNVIVQIKYGPIDFQVREPVSPLFASLRHTNQAIEVQVTQEYLGQQRHLVYLVPMWKQTLDFDLRAENRSTPVKEIVEGKSFRRPSGGFVAVANVGLDTNWLAHPLAMANLYGFGRLAWDPNLSSEAIVNEWTKLTFGNDPLAVATISKMQLGSWRIYEDYTGPLGLGTLTDIIGVHYGPGIESAERNGWGQWIRADHDGVGMDRTVATGTGYIGQYPVKVAKQYESEATCPEELLLFMHHVAYSHRLHSGKTVLQHIYDSHYTGAAGAAELVDEWRQLKGKVDDDRYSKVHALQRYQAGHAVVWRDAITNWFQHISGIPDSQGRVGHYPDRIEAEQMQLAGYAPTTVTPWETASNGSAIVCNGLEVCSASTRFNRPAGLYDVVIQYFDFHDGASTFTLKVDKERVANWRADANLPTNKLNGHTSTRYTVEKVGLRPGEILTIEGRPDRGEPAPLDYLEFKAVIPSARLQ